LRKKKKVALSALQDYLRRKLLLSRRGLIIVNDQILNDLSSHLTIDGQVVSYRLTQDKSVRLDLNDHEIKVHDSGQGLSQQAAIEILPAPGVSSNGIKDGQSVQIFYRNDHSDQVPASVSLLVGGTEVETLSVQGENLAGGVVIDLPTTLDQKEARTQIILDETTVKSLKQTIDTVVNAFRQDPRRLAPTINSLACTFAVLRDQNRIKSFKKDDDLFNYLSSQISQSLASMNHDYVILPAGLDLRLTPEALGPRTPVALDARLWDFDPQTVGGKIVPGSGKSIWSIAMEMPYAKVSDRLYLLSRRIVEEQFASSDGRTPVLLDLIFRVWLGYGQRPEVEAAINHSHQKAEAPMATNVAAQPQAAQQQNRPMPHHQHAQTILNDYPELDSSLAKKIFPYLSQALQFGQTPSDIRKRLDRVLSVSRLGQGLSQEVLTTSLEIRVPRDLLIGRTYPQSGLVSEMVQGRFNLYRITPERVLPIPLISGVHSIDSVVRFGQSTLIVAQQHKHLSQFDLYELRHDDFSIRKILSADDYIDLKKGVNHQNAFYFPVWNRHKYSLYKFKSHQIVEIFKDHHSDSSGIRLRSFGPYMYVAINGLVAIIVDGKL
jgi:hypothetical protein